MNCVEESTFMSQKLRQIRCSLNKTLNYKWIVCWPRWPLFGLFSSLKALEMKSGVRTSSENMTG